MTFSSFIDRYTEDMITRLKENTWSTKEHIIRSKLTPYFGRLKLSKITPQQIITWQNELLNYRDGQGKPYSPVYLRTIQNQLSAIFNHAVRYYAVPWWEKEIEALTIDVAASIRFFQQECTDEEIWWLGEITEDLAEKTQSRELLQSMRSRAELVQDKQKREEALKDIDDAFEFITEEETMNSISKR